MMFIIAMANILIRMSLALVRVRLGPTVFDRNLVLNMIGTKTVLLFAVVDFLPSDRTFSMWGCFMR